MADNSEHTSYWRRAASAPVYPVLTEDIEADVAVIGGGIAGLSAAYLLTQSGRRVVVLEKATLGSGTTGYTTGKVTSQHHLFYTEMEQRLGPAVARPYALANQAAIGQIHRLIKQENIDAGWQADDAYVFTTDPRQVSRLRMEAEAAQAAGLPASFVTQTDLPFSIAAAVKFSNQAKMDAQRYVWGLAAAIERKGGHVFENSRVLRIRDGSPVRVMTGKASVFARDVVVATNVPMFPLLARASYCLWEYPHDTCGVAGWYNGNLRGMYISPDENHYSILPYTSGNRTVLIVVGGGHIPGTGRAEKRYSWLADYAAAHFEVTQIQHRWVARDYMAYDGVPLVGKLYPWSKHVYVATAFKKWGLTNTMVAARILRNYITGEKEPVMDIFNSLRWQPVKSIPSKILSSLG